jgi:hypothetical protein
MYHKASIKLRSPKAHVKVESKQLIRLTGILTSAFTQIKGAMNSGTISDPSFIGSSKDLQWKKMVTPKNAKVLIQKTSDKKNRQPWKTQRGLLKRLPMKKEATLKNAKGLNQKTSIGKRGNPEKCKGAYSKDHRWKNRQPQKMQRGLLKRPQKKGEHQKAGAKKTSNEKRQPNMLLWLSNHKYKSLVLHRKLADQHSSIKGVPSQSYWFCVPMFNVAGRGTIAHSRMGHWHINFMHCYQKWCLKPKIRNC